MKSASVAAGSIKPAITETSRTDAPLLPRDRAFGFTFAVVFALLAVVMAWRGNDNWWVYTCVAATFALLALTVPRVLHPLNIAWMALGNLLNRIVNPIVMGAIFFAVITPVALVLRMRGRDVLQRRFAPERETYWIEREPPGPDIANFPRQF